MTLPPIGLGCAVPCDLLPDSQFLCWSHSAKALALNTAKMLHLSMPSHLGVSYIIPCVLPLTWVLSQSMVLQSTSMWPCVTYLVDCFTDSLFLCLYFWCIILWPEVSVTSGWQLCSCNCSVFFTCIRSGSPHNVTHSSSTLDKVY